MDRDAWLSKDREWHKHRRQSWKSYEKNLKNSKRFDKNDLKYFKEYFLHGIEPKDTDSHYYDENITLPLIIKAWLYPDCDEQDWTKIKDDVLNNSLQPETDVTRSYRLLFELGDQPEYSLENELEDGFFLGKEPELIRFFCGKPGVPEVVSVENTNYLRYCSGIDMFLSFITTTVGWLLAETKPNPFFIYQYLFENWKDGIKNSPEYFDLLNIDNPPEMDLDNFDPDQIIPLGRFNKLKAALERLAKIRKSRIELEEPRKSFYTELCMFLDSDELPENLEKMWKHVNL